MKIGIIGAGRFGKVHADNLSRVAGVEIAAVADVDLGRAEAVGKPFQAKLFDDYQKLIAEGGVDAVTIALPHSLHAPSALAAAEAGLHILMEKPMAASVAECHAVLRAVRRAKVKLMMGFSHRFHSELHTAKRLIEDGRLGRISLVAENFSFGNPEFPKWVWRKEFCGGGILLFNNIHGIDRVMWLLGSEIVEVVGGASGLFAHEGDSEDNAAVTYRFANGAIGSLVTNFNPYAVPPKCDLDIYGDKGCVRITTWNEVTFADRLTTWTQKRSKDDHLVAEMEEFVNAIRGDREPLVTGEDGLRAQRVVQAMYESIQTGRPVQVERIK